MVSKERASQANLTGVLVVSFIIAFFSSSIRNSFQIFFTDISASLMKSRGEIALSASVFMLVQGASAPVIGYLSDKFGPKRTISFGILITGFSFILISYTKSLLTFTLLYGIAASIGLTAISFIPFGVLVDRVFPKTKRGLAFATITNGVGVGFIVLPPIWIYTQQHIGWKTVFLWIGIVFIVPLPFLLRFFLPEVDTLKTVQSIELDSSPTLLYQLKLILKNRFFYILSGSFFSCGISMAFIDVHLVPYMQDNKLSSVSIAVILGVLGALELFGGYVFGFLADRLMGINLILSLLYFFRGGAILLLLYHPTNSNIVLLFSTIFGLTYMGTVIITSAFTLELFGANAKGLAFGLVFLVHQIGALLSSSIGGRLFDSFNNYDWIIFLSGLMTIISGGFALTLPMKEQAKNTS